MSTEHEQMAGTLLADLKVNVLRPDYPIADLLRACLMLGSELGSEKLQQWATEELQGYSATDSVPEYRQINVQMRMDYVLGNNHVRGIEVTPGLVPRELREVVSRGKMPMKHSADSLAAMLADAKADAPMQLTHPGLSSIPAVINRVSSEPFLQVYSVYYVTSRAELAAVLGAIRTQMTQLLVGFGKPLTGLPTGAEADRMVEQHTSYTQNNYGNQGAVAQGDEASAQQVSNGVTAEQLTHVVADALEAITPDQPDELRETLEHIAAAVSQEATPDAATVEGWQQKLAGFIQSKALAPAATTAVTLVTTSIARHYGIS